MKNFVTLTIIFEILFAKISPAQNTFPSTGSVGIGTTTPNSSSILEVKSTTKGVLMPRMTKSQRDAIASPAQGLLIYQTNSTPGFYYYDGGWSAVAPKNANKSLSNLTAPTAINVDLLPGTDNTSNLGSVSSSWKNLYIDSSIFLGGSKFISNAGYYSTFTGYQAGNTNTGISNSGFGYLSLFSSTIGEQNTAIGGLSLYSNTEGLENTALGYQSLYHNVSSSDNTAAGAFALTYNTGSYNSAFGYEALYENTTGADNAALGNGALYNNTFGYYNAAVGNGALGSTVGSNNNTAIGYAAGGIYDNGYNNTFVGANTRTNGYDYYNVIAIGNGTVCTAPSQAQIGNSSTTSIGGYADWTNFSDARYKKNIQSNVPGLAFINLLKPITYTLSIDGIESKLHPAGIQIKTPTGETIPNPMDNPQMRQAMEEKSKIVYTGFAAQDVEKAAQSIGYYFSGVDKPKDDQTGFYGLRYGDFVVPLVKAVQELSEQNLELKKEVEELKSEIENPKSSLSRSDGEMSNGSTKLSLNGSGQITLLGQNIPNPFDNSTLILFRIPKDCKDASIMIANASTSEVMSVIPISCNEDHVSIDAGTLASGTYSYTLYVDGKMIDTKTMILAK